MRPPGLGNAAMNRAADEKGLRLMPAGLGNAAMNRAADLDAETALPSRPPAVQNRVFSCFPGQRYWITCVPAADQACCWQRG